MDTRTNQDGTNVNNTKLLVGIVGAIALLLIIWMTMWPKKPMVDSRDPMNTPNTIPATR